MLIRRCVLNRHFHHFWMKTVEDVNLNCHCINCLIGQRDYRITPKKRTFVNLELPDKIHYLCGVVYPFDWASNFHLAFRPCEGKVLIENQNGVWIRIEDAEKLPISPQFIDPSNPHSEERLFKTCRNWQFANWYRQNIQTAESVEQDFRAKQLGLSPEEESGQSGQLFLF